MTGEQRKLINSKFYCYEAYKQQVKSALDDAIYSGTTTDYSKMHVSSVSGVNGVENYIIKTISDCEQKSLWVKAFDYTLIKYTGEYKDSLIKMKYLGKCSRKQICSKLHIGTATYNRWLNEILETAYMWCRNLKIF